MKRNVAGQFVDAMIISKTDGSPVTSGTTNVFLSGDGGAQVAVGGSPSCAHLGNGLWSYQATQAETDYGHISFTFVNSSGVNANIQVYPSFPQTGDNFARLGAPAGVSVSADIAAAKVDTAAVKAKTDFLPSTTAGASGGVFIAGTNAATAITTALTANVIGNVTGNLSGSVGSLTTNNDKTGYGLSAAAVQSIWDALTSALTTVGSVGKRIADFLTGDAYVRLGAPAGASTAADIASVKVDTAAAKLVTDKINTTMESTGSPTDYVFTARALAQAPSGTGASAIAIADEVQTRTIAGVTLVVTTTNLTNAPSNGDLTAAMKASVTTAATASTPALSTAGNAAVADKILGRNLAGGSDGTRTVQDALRSLRNKVVMGPGTITVYQEDDTATAWTGTTTTAAGDPLTSIDPA